MVGITNTAFKDCLTQPEPSLDLARAALLFARDEYPGLEINDYLNLLDDSAASIRNRLPLDAEIVEILSEINQFLFAEQGFSGNNSDYYDPRNSFLNEVLDRKLGIPITLSVIYLEIAWRLDLPLEGVNFPGHFLVKLMVDDGVVVLDPFFNGSSLSEDDLRERLQLALGEESSEQINLARLLNSVGKKDILARMLRNLKTVYVNQSNYERALAVSNQILIVNPKSEIDIRDRGLILEQMECPRAALSDYRRYLTLAPEANDRKSILGRLKTLNQNVPRIH